MAAPVLGRYLVGHPELWEQPRAEEEAGHVLSVCLCREELFKVLSVALQHQAKAVLAWVMAEHVTYCLYVLPVLTVG